MRIFVFYLTTKSSDGRPHIVAIPEDKIYELSSIGGSQNCYCRINGNDTTISFDTLVNLLGERVDLK